MRKSTMNILHIVSGMDPSAGGVTQAVRTMMLGLEASGKRNEVLCLDSPVESFIKESEFKIHALGPSKTAWRYSSQLLPWLKNNLGNYDGVILHGLWQYQSYALMKAIRNTKAKQPKLFVMPHGMLDPYFQKAKGRKLKAIRNWLFWKLIERHPVNQADCLLWTCETEKLLAARSFQPYHPRQHAVVGLGLTPPPSFTPAMQEAFRKKCANGHFENCLLFISRIHPKKGVDSLIRTYLALQHHASLPLLVIAGPGMDTHYGKQMRELAGNNANIIFTGMLDGDARWGAFYSCSAMILPSHQENFGFVVVEAMACAKPVLITNQVNIWREVNEGKAGMIADDTPKGTEKLLSDWLKLTDRSRQDMGTAAKKAYEEYFSLTGATQRLNSIIEDVIGSEIPTT